MHRSLVRLATPRLSLLPPLPRSLPLSLRVPRAPSGAAFASTSSSPKKAEEASAQSGGSRSKDFKEEAESQDAKHTGSASLHDSLSDRDARGRTGGGKPLDSSDHAPAQPKIWNASAPGDREKLTEEQKADVDQHNKEFEEKHDRASPAEDDKVDKAFWTPDDGKSVKK